MKYSRFGTLEKVLVMKGAVLQMQSSEKKKGGWRGWEGRLENHETVVVNSKHI